MKVIQIPHSISDDSYEKLMRGEYIKDGGVIRDKFGHIVEHLGDLPDWYKKILKNKQLKKNVLLGLGGFVAGGVTVFLMNKGIKNEKLKNKKELTNEVITNHNQIMISYIDKISEGKLDIACLLETINHLRLIIELIAKKEIEIEFDINQTNELFYIINNYTINLAKLNNIELELKEENEETSLSNILKCLELQKTIFEMENEEKKDLCIIEN